MSVGSKRLESLNVLQGFFIGSIEKACSYGYDVFSIICSQRDSGIEGSFVFLVAASAADKRE